MRKIGQYLTWLLAVLDLKKHAWKTHTILNKKRLKNFKKKLDTGIHVFDANLNKYI